MLSASGSFTAGTTVYEAMPEIAQILRKHKISGREYLLTKIAAMIAETTEGAVAIGAVQAESGGLFGPARQFWTAMDAALKADAAEWRKVREELAKLGRHKVW